MPHTLWNKSSFAAFFKENKLRHPWAMSRSFFKHICQLFSMYVQEMFRNMLYFHSLHSLQELALLTRVKKAFLSSFCHDMLLSLLSDRANVETFTVCKYLKCLPAMSFIKKIIALNFFYCHLPVWFYKKLLWISFHLYWLKWKLCQQCVVWSFCSLAVSPNRKKCGLFGGISGEMKAPGLAQESSCVHTSRELETCKKQTSTVFGQKKYRQPKWDKQKSLGNKTGSRQQSRTGWRLSVDGEFG